MKARALAALAVVVGAAAGCAPTAKSVSVAAVKLPSEYASGARGGSAAIRPWRDVFADDALVALLHEAVARNFDLRIAMQRIEIGRANVQRATGLALPQVGLAAGAGVRKFGLYTMDGAGNATTDITPGQVVPENYTTLSAGLVSTWEVDLWGRLRNLRGAAQARYLATIEGANLVITTLVADIAVAYFELVALDRSIEVLETTKTQQARAVEIMRLQKEAGRTNELAVRQFEAQLANTDALRLAATQHKVALENQINLLLGRGPLPIVRAKSLSPPEAMPRLTAGVPSDLLRNRPDIRAAELEVQAAKLDLRAARAAFYPRLTISGGLGYEAFNPKYLFATPESLAYSLAAGIAAPLVNRSAIEADFSAVEASQIEAMVRYQAVILRSFYEVATALSAVERAGEVVAAQRERRAATAGAIDAADALFRAAKVSYLDVLVAQQSALEAELELNRALRDRQLAAVHLYKALGGGWRPKG